MGIVLEDAHSETADRLYEMSVEEGGTRDLVYLAKGIYLSTHKTFVPTRPQAVPHRNDENVGFATCVVKTNYGQTRLHIGLVNVPRHPNAFQPEVMAQLERKISRRTACFDGPFRQHCKPD